MQIAEVNRVGLDSFIASQKHSQFLQSWEWGDFQERTGKKVIRLGFSDDDKLFFAITLIKSSLPLGLSYFYAPRIGIKFLSEEQLKFVFAEIGKVADKERVVFLRFEPRSELKIKNEKIARTAGGLRIKKTIDVQPKKTLILNISKSEEELLQSMHKKTRYNIRLAEKKGVIVREARENDFDAWWKIMEETKERDNFKPHSKEHYKAMLQFKILLYVAEFQEKVIAGNIIASFGDMATYVHGASSNQHRNVMAPYLLQWEAIKTAKKRGYKYYDFYGIDETKWPGVTRFKNGFSGKKIIYPGTFDLVYNNFSYNLYKFLRKIRRII